MFLNFLIKCVNISVVPVVLFKHLDRVDVSCRVVEIRTLL